jgi:Na+/melibiose symporter-like transporter
MKKLTIIYGSLAIIFVGFLAYYITDLEVIADITTVLVILFLLVAVLLMMVVPVYGWLKELTEKEDKRK